MYLDEAIKEIQKMIDEQKTRISGLAKGAARRKATRRLRCLQMASTAMVIVERREKSYPPTSEGRLFNTR